MKSFVLLMISAGLLFACSKEEKTEKGSKDTETIEGSRSFAIDAPSTSFVVKLFGVQMGSPDTEAVGQILTDAQAENWIDELVQLEAPIEAGIHSCVKISDPETRELVLQRLQAVETSLVESTYSITSVSNCGSL